MPTAPQVVVTEFIDEAALADLKRDFTVHYDPKLVDQPDEIVRLAATSPGLIVRNATQVRGAMLDGLKKLKVVGRLGVGLDNIDMDACRARGIEVFPATGANTVSVAEYVIAGMLIALRPVWTHGDKVMGGWWGRTQLLHGEAMGRTLGLIGFGAIARAVAVRARAFDMRLIAYDPAVAEHDPIWAQHGASKVDLDQLYAQADVISMHVPLHPSTRNMVGAAAIARMKKTAIIINTARGGVIDEAALAAALKEGRLGGAVLDVFASEPVKPGSPLAGAPNLIATPHIAGNTIESNVRVSRVTVEAVHRALKALT